MSINSHNYQDMRRLLIIVLNELLLFYLYLQVENMLFCYELFNDILQLKLINLDVSRVSSIFF